jgi:glutathione synthase
MPRKLSRKTVKKRLLWVADPWETLDHAKDTTLRLMEESLQFAGKVESWFCDVQGIRIEAGKVRLNAARLLDVRPDRGPDAFHWAEARVLEPRAFDRIIYRTDPPVDHAYIHPLQMLHLGVQGSTTRIVNPAAALVLGNEKFEATRLGRFAPASVISSNWEILREFGRKEGATVLKPLHEAQSKGVELIGWKKPSDEQQAHTKLAILTESFTRPVILQRYLKGIEKGESRLWFLDGRLLAHVRKLPKPGTFRIDMDRGGTLALSPLAARERRAAEAIGKLLKQDGIRMAAVDLIDGLVTDYNHTSPGLLSPMETLLDRNLASHVISALIRK